MSKLKNIEAVQKMLAGEHRTQTRKTFGFSQAYDNAKARAEHAEGDIWEELDENGKIVCWWEMKNGNRIRHTMHPSTSALFQEIRNSANKFPNCQKESCTCTNPTNLDKKFRRINGMCEDCTISYETRLKIRGEFNQYAIDKMRSNAEAYFKDADAEIQRLRESIPKTEFINSERGDIEKWEWDGAEQFMERFEQLYEMYKSNVLNKLGGTPVATAEANTDN